MAFASVFREGLLKGKVAIVTGGATGIGKAITEELLHLGCRVTIASRDEQKLKNATEELKKVYPNISYVACNIRKEDDVINLVGKTVSNFGRLDFVVNNGGGQFVQGAASISAKGWHAVIETNLTGTFLMCREAFKQSMEEHGGAIVNITMDNYRGVPYMAHSGAARAAVENLTKTLAVEWADSGVRVNSVAPGNCIYSETAAANYGDKSVLFQEAIPYMPAKRLGTPEEIAPLVCFLLSDGASFISGQSIGVDAASRYYARLMHEIPDHNKWPEPLRKSKL